MPDTVRATAVTKQIGAVNTNIAAERVRLRQRAAELQRMLDETTRELAAVNERTSALDKDEYVFSAIMDRTIINMAEYFASKHLPAVNAPTAAVSYPLFFSYRPICQPPAPSLINHETTFPHLFLSSAETNSG